MGTRSGRLLTAAFVVVGGLIGYGDYRDKLPKLADVQQERTEVAGKDTAKQIKDSENSFVEIENLFDEAGKTATFHVLLGAAFLGFVGPRIIASLKRKIPPHGLR